MDPKKRDPFTLKDIEKLKKTFESQKTPPTILFMAQNKITIEITEEGWETTLMLHGEKFTEKNEVLGAGLMCDSPIHTQKRLSSELRQKLFAANNAAAKLCDQLINIKVYG